MLVFSATFSYIVVQEITDLTQSHSPTCVCLFQRLCSIIIIRCLQRSRRTRGIFDLIHILFWKLISQKNSLKIPIIIYRRRTDNTMTYRKKDKWTNIHIKTRWLYIKQRKKWLHITRSMQSRIWAPQGQTEQTKDFTLKYKRYAKPYMSPTWTNRTNKGLHIEVQKVCKAVYEPHRDKQNKETKKRKG